MTSTEIAVRQNGQIATERDVVDGWITVAADVSKLSDYIAETEFVPKALRNKPAAIAACILTGRELGIGPMASLKSIHMVQGTPSLAAEYKRARALAAGHQIAIDESNATRCVVRGRRAGAENWVTITWTLDMARRAKLDGKDVWKQYPQRMLQARATGELCDLVFPDATLGLPTTEELEDGGALAAAVAIEAAAEDPPAAEPAKPRTVQRKARQAAPDPAPSPAAKPAATGTESGAPAAQPTSSSAAAASGPPLPGEDESEENPEDKPGSASADQLTKLWTVFTTKFAFTKDDKAQARAAVEQVIGRKLAGGTTKDLSLREARVAIDTLEQLKDRAQLVAVLAETAAVSDA